MQLYKDKIYLGAGNSSNVGPAQNAGRVYVVSLNPKTDTFKYEYKVAEEQIDLFKVYGNTLYVPGHDATQKWTFGNIYSKKNNKWTKYRTLPKALHVYDLVEKDGQIFTAVGLYKKGSIFISDRKAQQWKQLPQGKGRVYSFLEVGDEIFATKTFKSKNSEKLNITQWLDKYNTFSARYDLNIYKMFPDTKFKNKSIKITRSAKTNIGTFYLGAYTHNDHQSKPFGVYFIDKNLNISKVKLNKNVIPRDIIIRGENIFLLASKKNNVIVYRITSKSLSVSHHLSFEYPTFARSFEEFEGCFYFGMGSDIKRAKNWSIEELKPQTGDIIKVCDF